MAELPLRNDHLLTPSFLRGGGEMGERIREFDWSRTALGPFETWSPALRTLVGILLVNRFPLLLWWGPSYVSIYNDAYSPILGAKHPHQALGLPVSECWAEIWTFLKPLIDTPFSGGESTWMEDMELELNRNGFLEEAHFTIAYSPVPDETAHGGIGGVLATVHEITEKIVVERRSGILRELAANLSTGETAEASCESAANVLVAHPKDILFAAIYLLEPGGTEARRVGAGGAGVDDHLFPVIADFSRIDASGWPWADALRSDQLQVVSNPAHRFPNVDPAHWKKVPTAVLIPIRSNKAHEPAGLLVIGLSSRLKFDDLYQDFVQSIANQIATSVANHRALQEERNRAAALAEIDRAKTDFFSNVSHEFRTPLTLMIGPLEELRARASQAPALVERGEFDVLHRNSLRLLKLVNTLLDFSRIEAGRAQASFVATNLGPLTTELASAFSSAMAEAGLTFAIESPPLPEPVFVDPDLWEKVVFNLLSNALKYTLTGEVRLSLRGESGHALLSVRDSGLGIASAELPNLFKRFHRIENVRGRTHEGSGIGLALVQELVKLHGGTIEVESQPGQGTEFCVRIPYGKKHLAAERIDVRKHVESPSRQSDVFVQEAMSWLPEIAAQGFRRKEAEPLTLSHGDGSSATEGGVRSPPRHPRSSRPRILLVEDNADMREYVRRLLANDYEVEACADGAEALEVARRAAPDLLLSDVMMPNVNGFQLVQQIRTDETLRTLPIILLSARAGEEARVEGAVHGADDYLTKPFTARELRSRVSLHLKLAGARLRDEQALRLAKERAEAASRSKDDFLAALSHELRTPLTPVLMSAAELKDDPRLPDDIQRQLALIEQNIALEARLIDDLLDLTAIAHGKLKLRLEPCDLNTLVSRAMGMVELDANAKNLVIACEYAATPSMLSADVTRLQQVFWNLLRNAVKFTPGGGKVSIRTLETTGPDNQPWQTVEVSDTGIGIDAAQIGRIFQAFEQGSLSGDHRFGGLGLGLAIAQAVVTAHQGRLRAKSEGVGRGATFIVDLPRERVAASLEPITPPRSPRSPSEITPLRLLLVDDHESTLQTLARLLRRDGHQVTTAATIADAQAASARNHFDLVISDLGLPDGSGTQLMAKLRDQYGLHGIALSGYGMENDFARSREAGFVVHLVKPVAISDLRRALEDVWRARKPSQSETEKPTQ